MLKEKKKKIQYANSLSSSNSCDAIEEKKHFECCASFRINFLLHSQITEHISGTNWHVWWMKRIIFIYFYADPKFIRPGEYSHFAKFVNYFSPCANLDWLCDRRTFFTVHAFHYTDWNEPDTPGLTLPKRGKKESIYRCKKGRHNQLLNKLWKSTPNFIVCFTS